MRTNQGRHEHQRASRDAHGSQNPTSATTRPPRKPSTALVQSQRAPEQEHEQGWTASDFYPWLQGIPIRTHVTHTLTRLHLDAPEIGLPSSTPSPTAYTWPTSTSRSQPSHTRTHMHMRMRPHAHKRTHALSLRFGFLCDTQKLEAPLSSCVSRYRYVRSTSNAL